MSFSKGQKILFAGLVFFLLADIVLLNIKVFLKKLLGESMLNFIM